MDKIEKLCRAICEAEHQNPDVQILPEGVQVGAFGRIIVYGVAPQWTAYHHIAKVMLNEVAKWRDDD